MFGRLSRCCNRSRQKQVLFVPEDAVFLRKRILRIAGDLENRHVG